MYVTLSVNSARLASSLGSRKRESTATARSTCFTARLRMVHPRSRKSSALSRSMAVLGLPSGEAVSRLPPGCEGREPTRCSMQRGMWYSSGSLTAKSAASTRAKASGWVVGRAGRRCASSASWSCSSGMTAKEGFMAKRPPFLTASSRQVLSMRAPASMPM
uniref:Uncharacterized protein n=1 Tax=Triticum urartu TaxID=4572 RepID=A0A8R7PYW7_TRIUA